MQHIEQNVPSSNPLEVRATLQTQMFLSQFLEHPSAPAHSLERQISVLKTKREGLLTKRRKIKYTIKAKTIELHSIYVELLGIKERIERLRSLQEPDTDADEG